jgi:cation:H+ antiporter
VVFVVSLCALIKAADWFSLGAQTVAGKDANAALAVATVCVALPELAAALAAALQGRSELVAALAIGSAVANILLVIGIGAVAVKSMQVNNEYIDRDLPLFAVSVAFFCLIAMDGLINRLEGILCLVVFFVYAMYVFVGNRHRTLTPQDVITPETIAGKLARLAQVIPTRLERNLGIIQKSKRPPLWKTAFLMLGGGLLLAIAANFTIDALVKISENTKSIEFLATISAATLLAAGVALPEIFAGLAVSRKKQYDIMMGNVFSVVTINLLLTVGIASLLKPLELGGTILNFGLPFLAVCAVLLTISTRSRRINFSEGVMYLFLYFLFFVKLLELF